MIPSVSSSFRHLERTFSAMSGMVLLSSPKRMGPLSRSHMMGGFHLPPITSIVAVMGHSSALCVNVELFFASIS